MRHRGEVSSTRASLKRLSYKYPQKEALCNACVICSKECQAVLFEVAPARRQGPRQVIAHNQTLRIQHPQQFSRARNLAFNNPNTLPQATAKTTQRRGRNLRK